MHLCGKSAPIELRERNSLLMRRRRRFAPLLWRSSDEGDLGCLCAWQTGQIASEVTSCCFSSSAAYARGCQDESHPVTLDAQTGEQSPQQEGNLRPSRAAIHVRLI